MSEQDREQREETAALIRQRKLVDRVVAYYRWDADVAHVEAVLGHAPNCKCPVCS